MKQYLVLSLGGKKPTNPAEVDKMMAEWMAWFNSMGKAVVDTGSPFANRGSVGNVGAGSQAQGYMMLEAENLEAALKLVRKAPGMDQGGMEVLELAQKKA